MSWIRNTALRGTGKVIRWLRRLGKDWGNGGDWGNWRDREGGGLALFLELRIVYVTKIMKVKELGP
jgi:hypothetical protein